MMRRKPAIYLLLMLATAVSAQNTLVPSVSNYHLTWTTINPAFAGFRDAISVSSMYRSGLYGGVGPYDMQLNLHSPVGNSKVALGGVVAFNGASPDQQLFSLMTNYAYRMYMGSGRLSLGLSAGMYGVNSDMSAVLIRDPGDPSFATEPYQKWFPNFAAGALYYTDNYFLGISVPELLTIPAGSQSVGGLDLERWRVMLTGAYLFDFSRAFRLKPSVMIDYNKASSSFKASLNAGFMDSRVFIGGAYDHPNYAIALLNVQVNPQWLIGYAYTIGLGDVATVMGGAHEVVLRWELRPVIRTIPDDPFYF